jgi:hypothetical protein
VTGRFVEGPIIDASQHLSALSPILNYSLNSLAKKERML